MQIRTIRQTGSLKQIDWQDPRFRTSYFFHLDPLKRSISEVGILNLPLLQKISQDQFRIVCGLRRLTALRELNEDQFDALIVDRKISDLQLMELVLFENLSVRDFNIMEKAHIISNLKNSYKIPEAILLKKYLPLLNLGNNPRWLTWSKHLIGFPTNVQQAFAHEKISYDLIDFLVNLNAGEKENIIYLIDTLHLGKNRQKELIVLLSDLLRQKKILLSEFLCQLELSEVISNNIHTPSQKTVRFFNWLKVQRYPGYSKMEKNFQDLVRSFKLPNKMQLKHSPYFEEDWFKIQLQFRNITEFKQAVQIQLQLDKSNKMKKVFDLFDLAFNR